LRTLRQLFTSTRLSTSDRAQDRAQDTAQVIRLEVDDDITTVRAKLETAEAPRVVLVVPPGCQAFDSLLDFKLLQRYAESLTLEVALVTKSTRLRVLARQVGFPHFHFRQPGPEKGQVAPTGGDSEVAEALKLGRAPLCRFHLRPRPLGSGGQRSLDCAQR